MDQRQFFATVLAVILLGISVAMGVNMIIDESTVNTPASKAVVQDQEVSLNFDNIDVSWNTFPHAVA